MLLCIAIVCIAIVIGDIAVVIYCIVISIAIVSNAAIVCIAIVNVYHAIVCIVMSAHSLQVVSITWCHQSQLSHLGFSLSSVTQAQSQGCTCLVFADCW